MPSRPLVCSVCHRTRREHPELAFFIGDRDVRCADHPPSMDGYEKLEPIADDIKATLERHRELLKRLSKL